MKNSENWKELKTLIAYQEDGIMSKLLINDKGSKFNVTLFCMAKGTDMSEHTSTKEGIVHVIEGKGTFNLEGEDIPMLPGTFIHMKKNAAHSLKAEDNTSFILYLAN